MIPLPAETVAAAHELLKQGWSPLDPIGRVDPPLGVQAAAAHWVSDTCWQAMALMQLQAKQV